MTDLVRPVDEAIASEMPINPKANTASAVANQGLSSR